MYPSNPLAVGNAIFNPYLSQLPNNPVVPNYQPVQQQGPRMQIDTVNGKESAYAYNIGVNSSVILADAMKPKIWMVTTDSSGYKMVKGFKIEPDDEDENRITATVMDSDVKEQMSNLAERLDKLEEKVNEYGKSDSEYVNSGKSGNGNVATTNRSSSSSK
jgi:spermidine/putrescine-binding protein